MELDPGIHIVMHSVLFLNPGVTGGEERLGQTTGGVARWGEASAARGSGGAGLRQHVARL
jgi:hypothetical protein